MTPQDIIDILEHQNAEVRRLSQELATEKASAKYHALKYEQLHTSVALDAEYFESLTGFRGTHILKRKDGFEKVTSFTDDFPPILRYALPPKWIDPRVRGPEPAPAMDIISFRLERYLYLKGHKVAIYREI